MKISVTNTKKLEAAIQDAEGSKSTARTISARDVAVALEEIEKKLRTLMPKKNWLGAQFDVDVHGRDFPNSYTGKPYSTQFRIERFPNGWFITALGRSATKRYNQRIEPVNLDMDAVTKTIKDSKFWS
ncbi:hypothetical protein [Pseudoalteromonas 'SMAR']|uniref:hypothetical protein n=1 Tax=Pseudoalteromonas 'SMAR' TaxID=3416908 RepID=UPI001A159255|nr:hypothetical protein [Rhodospirillales bacterium]|tara:strand:- start:72 stop:455 length:384 start_codon:yes stop_codon:yes gene_type:complete